MTDCEHYGMGHGCDVDCPVLLRHECELQDSDNNELYLDALEQHFNIVVLSPMTELDAYYFRIGI